MSWFQENRGRILLTVVLAVLWFLLFNYSFNLEPAEVFNPKLEEPAKASSVSRQVLMTAYRDYNSQYFNGKLPLLNVAINYDLNNSEYMALTTEDPEGNFEINFNPYYVTAERVADVVMLHEMCHIQNFGDNHGKKWCACMYTLDAQGAFRDELIESFRGLD